MDTCYIIAVAGGRPVVGFVRLFTTEMNFPKIPSNYYGLNAKENKSLGYSGMNFSCIGVENMSGNYVRCRALLIEAYDPLWYNYFMDEIHVSA